MRIFRAATIFDGVGIRPGSELVVDDAGTVVEVRAVQPAPAGAEVIDHGPGSTVLPGLVDGHQHLSWGCTAKVLDGIPDDHTAQSEQTIANARRALAAGVTTVQDLGDSAYTVVEVRDATGGNRSLPRILASGPPVTPPGGHCHFLGGAETRTGDIEAAVRERAERGVDVVKVMVSGGNVTPGSLPWESQFDGDALRRIVGTARSQGLPVAAHAHGSQALRDCVAARVDTIEHCTFMMAEGIDDDPVFQRELAESGIVVRITPGSVPGSPPPPPAIAARIALLRPVIARLRDLGARIVVSTDAGVSPGKPHDVMAYAVHQFGAMTGDPVDALARATSVAADALGLTGVCGRLAPGHDADLLVVDGDPARDLAALLEVKAVYRGGDHVAGPSTRPAPALP
jgi:imidazolonepropionase-like amidohydrolase